MPNVTSTTADIFIDEIWSGELNRSCGRHLRVADGGTHPHRHDGKLRKMGCITHDVGVARSIVVVAERGLP